MSQLRDRLQRIKANFLEKAPAAAVAAIDRSTQEIRDSGLLSRGPALGSPMPAFELPDTEENLVRSKALVERGPLVITFYRGHW